MSEMRVGARPVDDTSGSLTVRERREWEFDRLWETREEARPYAGGTSRGQTVCGRHEREVYCT